LLGSRAGSRTRERAFARVSTASAALGLKGQRFWDLPLPNSQNPCSDRLRQRVTRCLGRSAPARQCGSSAKPLLKKIRNGTTRLGWRSCAPGATSVALRRFHPARACV
jgi:hypothetical protein